MSNSPFSPPPRPEALWSLTSPWAAAFAARGFDVAGALDLSFVDGQASSSEGNASSAAHPWLSGDLAAWRRWIASGGHADMRFMGENEEARANPRRVLESVKSCIVCLVPYATGARIRAGRDGRDGRDSGDGRDGVAAKKSPARDDALEEETVHPSGNVPLASVVARYARGSDYHKVLRKRFDALAADLARAHPDLAWRGVVDSIPFFDRAHARHAGLGFVGKNTMLIRPGLGSYVFIATLLVNLPVGAYAVPAAAGRLASLDCGECRKCLDACPTGALPRPYFLDASRCLSYLTIEHRGTIPDEFLPHLKDALYGCDICQEACPYNASTLDLVRMAEFGRPRASLLERSAWDLALADERDYEAWFGGSAMTRAKHGGLVRDALCYLYAVGDPRLPSALEARKGDPDPLIASTCAQLSALLDERPTNVGASDGGSEGSSGGSSEGTQ